MPATDSDPTSMEDSHASEEAERSSADMPSSAPPATVPPPTPLEPPVTRPNNFPSEIKIEETAVTVASNVGSSALSSPAEASPAKAAATPPAAFDGTVKTSPSTSRIASASDSLTCTGASLVGDVPEPALPVLRTTMYGSVDMKNDFPVVLTFKGISVTLENNSVWKQFHGCGTEMILTKSGRRMFPYCRYRLSGLEPRRKYSLVLSIVPTDQYKYRWNATKWELASMAENQNQGLIRAFSHHYSPSLGSEWMATLVSFYKLKLTNHPQDLDGRVVLHSMHRYIPRLHVIPVPDGAAPTAARPVVMGPESLTFTFPQTEFMAVTTYQNFRITQLKINHNPFAKGFREDGNNTRLIRVTADAQPAAATDTQPSVVTPAEPKESAEEVVDLSIKAPVVSNSFSNEQGDRLVLKPIMSTSSNKGEPYVTCLRGKHALGELVLVLKRPLAEPKEEPRAEVTVAPAASTPPPTPTPSPGSPPGCPKRRKRINRGWANSRGKDWKPPAASPTVYHSPSLTVAMQPELDDVEGLLFVSFTSKEALEVHVGDKPANGTPAASPISPLTPTPWREKEKIAVDATPETDEEKMARLEAVLLQDLRVLKHRQVIHPVLQQVGMKLSSLDPMKSIDLQYLGVLLPLPPPKLPEKSRDEDLSPGDKGSSFMSRTGKTSDMTKIKGWRNKFIKKKETSPSISDASQKNRSAFCSNMLDEYLESEAQYISERAAAFSTFSEDSVAYQLPVKSSSYVKTLDSVLKNRKAAAKSPSGANRPCPLSHKPLLYSALAAPPPPLAVPEAAVPEAAIQAAQPPASAPLLPVAQRLSAYLPSHVQKTAPPAASAGPSPPPPPPHKPSGLTRFQYRLTQMEFGALNQGLGKTQLTTDRLSVALAGLLTKQMLPSQVWKVTKCPTYTTTVPECGQEFCTLGCVCSSLKHLNRAPFHCRRPDCMFGCTCFKRKITKQLSAREELIQPVYSVTNMEHMVQPHPGSHANKLWNRDTHGVDPEPLFTPKSTLLCLPPAKVLKRSSGAQLTQPIREEDKGPVYKYLESLMTCARVRAFNSKPPPQLSIEPKIVGIHAKPQKTVDEQRKKSPDALLVKKAERVSERTASDEKEAKKQIEIQSACQWVKDRNVVLEALCQRMNQNRLSQRFSVGPYCVRPIAKIFMRKPSGSIVTYRLHISKSSKASDVDEDEYDDSGEETSADKSSDGELDPEEEDGPNEESDVQFKVTPFLSGVIPAGRLKARTKPVGCQASGLIQVNGKSYNQARLLLGNMGSLHPANRLAAFITGRLHPPGGISLKVSRKADPVNKITPPDPPPVKAAGAAAPPVITVKKPTHLKPPTQQQPAVRIFPPEPSTKGSANVLPTPLASGRRSSGGGGGFQKSLPSSPVSLTVSQSLKTPSFLGQSGTYSFRICPPANEGTRGQKLPGVPLPGGFTLIELPQPGADGAASETANAATANAPGVEKARPRREAMFNLGRLAADSDASWRGLNTGAAAMDLSSCTSVESRSSPELVSHVMVPSEESDETNSMQVESNREIASEDLSSDSDSESDSDSDSESSDSDSDSSDYGAERDGDDELVDVETVEEGKQGVAIAQMREFVRKAKKESGESSDGFVSMRKVHVQDKDNSRRSNHTFLERRRRSEQRTLFDKLQLVLKSDPRTSRLSLLSLAQKEIQNLTDTSRFLEEKKRRLAQMQAVYVKELSLLSGKPGMLIKTKLNDICKKQKVREKKTEWTPFFSNLLESKAALLQSTIPKLKMLPKPLLDPVYFRSLSQPKPPTTAVQNKLMSLLQSNLKRALTQTCTQPPKSLLLSSAARVEVPAPSPLSGQRVKEEAKREKMGSPAPVSVPTSQMQKCVAAAPAAAPAAKPAAPQVPAAQPHVHAATPAAPLVPAATPQVPAATSAAPPAAPQVPAAPPQVPAAQDGASSSEPLQSFSLPLVRSKNGRIILPSSLKPLGHGFYTLMVMEPRPKGEEDKTGSPANMKPYDVESSMKRDEGSSELDRRLDSGTDRVLENEKTVPASTSKPERSDVTAPVAELPLFNKSIFKRGRRSWEGAAATAVGLNKTPSTACSSFNRAKDIPASAAPRPGATAASRGRGGPGRPRNTPSIRRGLRETSLLAQERPNKNLTLVMTKTRAAGSPGSAQDKPASVKGRRGRPPKKKKSAAQMWSPPAAQARSITADPKEDIAVRLARIFRSPDARPKESPANASRPLTRGALGKDFPSAKKRSWIDVEKELEPAMESEPESESE
ncbi:MAX gene-associated protein isoform X2 [Clinocottus analis]|uniref:MAX gene-associated protein isoform X2 n=1 Tax=Clinocottus analis TaxID=304258 RepID=UPI0035BF8AE8